MKLEEDIKKKKLSTVQVFDIIIAFGLIGITSLTLAKLFEELYKFLPLKDRHKIVITFIWLVVLMSVTAWFLYTRIKDGEIDPSIFEV